jgi:hypothetical protein
MLILSENAALLQHGIDKGCFAVVDMGDDGDISDIRDFSHFKKFLSLLSFVITPPCGRAPLFTGVFAAHEFIA